MLQENNELSLEALWCGMRKLGHDFSAKIFDVLFGEHKENIGPTRAGGMRVSFGKQQLCALKVWDLATKFTVKRMRQE